jgi:hypothetical protein
VRFVRAQVRVALEGVGIEVCKFDDCR